jgi:hypothetical protein
MTTPTRRWFRWSLRAMFVVVTMTCLFAALTAHNFYAAMAVVIWLAIPALIVCGLAAGRLIVKQLIDQ